MSCGPLCCTGRSHTGSLNSAVWLVYKHVKAGKKKTPKKTFPPHNSDAFREMRSDTELATFHCTSVKADSSLYLYSRT